MSVTIYSTPRCPFCALSRTYFDERNIAYTDIDVSQDAVAAQRMIDMSKQMGVPVIVVSADRSASQKEEIVIGFHADALNRILGL